MNKTAISYTRFSVSSFVACLIVIASTLSGTNTAAAASRIFNFHLHNIDSRPVTFTIVPISPGNEHCYQGTPGIGQVFENVAPGQRVTITLARVQGHGCDGRGGRFGIEFTPGVGTHYKTQLFEFDNGGSLWLTSAPNSYPGRLSAKARDESYTYTTVATPKVTAGKAIGRWEHLCQGYCNHTVSKEITNSTTREKTQSRETTNAISVSLQAGVEFPGGSAGVTVTGSEERRIGQSMSDSITRGETNTRGQNIVFTPEQLRDFGIFAVWQWVASTQMSTGEVIIVSTDKITCTADGRAPAYLPGAREDIAACRGGLAAPPASQAAPAAPPQAAPAVAQRPVPGIAPPPGVKGANVTAIEFGQGGAKLGQYRLTGPKQWAEVPATGPIVFRFEETHRDEWSVYMVDRSRGVNLQLDLYTRKIMYSDARQPRRELYNILTTSASALP